MIFTATTYRALVPPVLSYIQYLAIFIAYLLVKLLLYTGPVSHNKLELTLGMLNFFILVLYPPFFQRLSLME